MKLRALIALAVAALCVAVTAESAMAKQASTRLSTDGGYADITKSWEWVPSLGTYRVQYWGSLTDEAGDGWHIRLYRQTEDSLLRVRIATYGDTVRFDGGPIYADKAHFQVCAYDKSVYHGCSALW